MAHWRLNSPTGKCTVQVSWKSHSKRWSSLSPNNPRMGHVSVLSLHSKLLQTQQLEMTRISYITISVGQLSWILCSGSHRAAVEVWAGARFSSETHSPCSSKLMIFIGRIYFLASVRLMVSCLFKANRRQPLCLPNSWKDSPDKTRPIHRLLINWKSLD